MTSQEQALAIADRWLNPEGSAEPRREVRMQEFDLGWVVWAAPAQPERDPETGERRPPAEIGDACGVVDRRSGELTVWPSVPVDEVVQMYRQKHGAAPGAGTADGAARPVTGPGNTAVFTYVDPANGEETTLFRTSTPGLPPAEYQAWGELRRMNVPADNVVAVHTDLRPSLLPGGYTAELLNTFRNAQLSCTQSYGARPEVRAEGVAALVEQVETMHRMAGQQPPPRPHRVPVPAQVTPAEPMRDVALGRHLVDVFGEDGVRRFDADDIADRPLPEAAKATLTWAGLPADLPLFFTADRPDAPPAGGLFTDVATNLRERRSPAGEEKIGALSYLVRIGFDGVAVIAVQCQPGSGQPDGLGALWAVDPVTAVARYVNFSVAAFARSLALLATSRQRMQGLDAVAAGAEVAALQEQLAAVDASALSNADTWWSLIVEQMWHGLF
ncbi:MULTISPECIES: SUKH-4 family immunity protein [unclassified Streptomyces]|uniref:SUKH-4 family immunity protein n=1 Tax=unclassified Streptomyces TaxID=2593676 RepID=UPI002366F56D|nr:MULTISPECIES: SUKH-4 family immunity protein [unclassified Streptomyces]MDF3140149.1 SUKH-4 family immunity protein [Streptomyces sp. T21Q-yed]WDF41741.1 SUKH-4 family immunity protein [Streptomyces sp. T12]